MTPTTTISACKEYPEPFTDHAWREKPCGCKQLYVEGFWENKIRCDLHQKIVDKVESKLPPILKGAK